MPQNFADHREADIVTVGRSRVIVIKLKAFVSNSMAFEFLPKLPRSKMEVILIAIATVDVEKRKFFQGFHLCIHHDHGIMSQPSLPDIGP